MSACVRRLAALAVVAAALTARPVAAAPPPVPPVPVSALMASPGAYDGLTVTVRGEVVGDIMRRRDVTWMNVNDGTGAVGVWGPPELLAGVRRAGAYGRRGDTVAVTGTFHQAAVSQGGDLALFAEAVSVVAEGGPVRRAVAPSRLRQALAATGLAAALGGLWLWRWRRLRDAGAGQV